MTPAPSAILYVDDDRANLASFQYLLADRFHILTASHSDEALRILASEEAAVLLADQRMESGMSGVELCTLARQRFPRVVRMLVTAYGDVETLRGGINDGQISAYIGKPWREDDMVTKLRGAIEVHRLERMSRDLQVDLLKGDQLSVSSFVVGHLLRELCNPAAAIRDNLDFSVGLLPLVEAALHAAPVAAMQRFRQLEQSLSDASSAAEAMVARMSHFRNGEAAPFAPQGSSPLGDVVATAAAVMRDEASKRATLSVEVEAEVVAEAAVDGRHLGRIVACLLVEALESISPGAPARNRLMVSSFAGVGYAGVAVETAGPHVRTVTQTTTFDPFPLAGDARARGMGWAIIRSLVETAGGEIAVQATAAGTITRVRFPLSRGAAT